MKICSLARPLAALALTLTLGLTALADTIHLKDGQVIRGQIVAFRDRGEEPCAHVLDLVDRRARDIAERIAALERMRGDLDRMASRARSLPRRAGSYCHLIEQAAG